MPATNVVCGKRKYHDFVFGEPEHGDWTREREKWQCGHQAKVKPTRIGPRFLVNGSYYTDYDAARAAELRGLAPIHKKRNGPRASAKCGTEGGYHRHYRNGEEACNPCLEAHATFNRTQKWGA